MNIFKKTINYMLAVKNGGLVVKHNKPACTAYIQYLIIPSIPLRGFHGLSPLNEDKWVSDYFPAETASYL